MAKPDGRSLKTLRSIIELMLNKRYMNDEICFLHIEEETEMKRGNEGDLVHLWKQSCMLHKTKTKHILKALQRRAPSPEEALETYEVFSMCTNILLIMGDHGSLISAGSFLRCKEKRLKNRSDIMVVRHMQSIPSSQMDSHPLKIRNWDIRFIRRHLVCTHRVPLKNLEDTLGYRIHLVMALCINSCF